MDIEKLTRYWFLFSFVLQLFFGLTFIFLLDAFLGMLYWPYTDLGIPRLFGAALLGYSFLNLLAYRKKEWECVKMVVLQQIVWIIIEIAAMLYIHFGLPTHPIVWINTIIWIVQVIVFIYIYIQRR